MSMAFVAANASWIVPALVGAGGVAANLYGANKQSQAVEDANKANIASQAEQNAAAWANYLMTRGINPAGAVTGRIPVNPQAINARLPLWANANFGTGTGRRWRKKGSGGAPANTLAVGPGYGGGAAPVDATAVYGGDSNVLPN